MRWPRFGPRRPDFDAGDETTLWALDLEMTGLDPAVDHIVEIGVVPIRGRRIRLGEAWSTVVQPEHYRSSGTIAHQLMPVDLAEAADTADALDTLGSLIGDAPLLCHHAPLDLSFLAAEHRRTGRPWPERPVIDTVELIGRRNRRLRQMGQAELPLQLDQARAALGLPAHGSHRALADAVATAELWLALSAPGRA